MMTMKGKHLIGMGLGLAGICVSLYRAPQIMAALSGESLGATSSTDAEPGGAISGLLKAIGKQPARNADLAALGLMPDTAEKGKTPDTSHLRIFGAENMSEAEAKRALERAASMHPSRALSGAKPAADDPANTAKRLKRPPKVVVHKPEQ